MTEKFQEFGFKNWLHYKELSLWPLAVEDIRAENSSKPTFPSPSWEKFLEIKYFLKKIMKWKSHSRQGQTKTDYLISQIDWDRPCQLCNFNIYFWSFPCLPISSSPVSAKHLSNSEIFTFSWDFFLFSTLPPHQTISHPGLPSLLIIPNT